MARDARGGHGDLTSNRGARLSPQGRPHTHQGIRTSSPATTEPWGSENAHTPLVRTKVPGARRRAGWGGLVRSRVLAQRPHPQVPREYPAPKGPCRCPQQSTQELSTAEGCTLEPKPPFPAQPSPGDELGHTTPLDTCGPKDRQPGTKQPSN